MLDPWGQPFFVLPLVTVQIERLDHAIHPDNSLLDYTKHGGAVFTEIVVTDGYDKENGAVNLSVDEIVLFHVG